LVSEYEHLTSFASFAFLSTPEESAETHLTPLLTKYISYLQNDWKNLVSSCELERMLSTAINPTIRNMFKTIEFQSIGHLLEVCFQYKNALETVQLAPTFSLHHGGLSTKDICNDVNAVRQALRDLEREIITVNGRILPPARNLKELARLLSQTLNSRTVSLSYSKGKKSRRGGNKGSTVPSVGSSSDSISSYEESDTTTSDLSSSDGDITSGNEGDTDAGTTSLEKVSRERMAQMAMTGVVLPPPSHHSRNKKKSSRRPSLDVNTIDFMTRRLLLAAGRTGTGGDAFFVVRDLFGGDDVEVIHSSTRRHAQNSTTSSGGTIELIVRLTSITIKCHGRYDVYPKPLLDDTHEPLITLHTTTTETISLQEVRARDSNNKDGDKNGSGGGGGGGGGTELVLREKKTATTGWRTLSLRPALYETVQVWNTPS